MNSAIPSLQEKPRSMDLQVAGPLVGLAILAGLVIWMVASQLSTGWFENRQERERVAFEEQVGIRVIRLALTAGGGMLDLQYQVVDPDKALVVHDDETPPTLVVQDTGDFLATPFHSHNAREVQVGLTYHQMILNGGGFLERGSKVTLKVGDFILENLIVE